MWKSGRKGVWKSGGEVARIEIKKQLLNIIAAAVSLSVPLTASGQEQIREFAPPIIREPGHWAASSYYDYSRVKTGRREGDLRVSSNTFTYSLNGLLTPYFSVNYVDFFHNIDSAGDLGAYLKFEDEAYLRAEAGFGGDVDYLYHFQTRLEYEHRLRGNLFWQAGARYLDLTRNDVYTAYPGLIYYFGEKTYVTGFYHLAHTEGWGNAHWGSIRGNLAVTKRLSVWLVTAAGERLFSIELLPASKQYGQVYSGGLDLAVAGWAGIKMSYSYTTQRPDVIRRGIQLGVILKF